ncbi:MAG TPA: pentapeptide repeat-containing protein [Ignavibacteriaceae bacterium]|nr:pentapeptide repeat-containing protein [Ignavibacteriaceae bacterium]
MLKEEFDNMVEQHQLFLAKNGGAKADFSGKDLRGEDFSNLDLRFANFSRANLSRSNFKNTKLQGADFKSANLSFSSLEFANAGGADFRDAIMIATNLISTDLTRANLIGCMLPFVHTLDLSTSRKKGE